MDGYRIIRNRVLNCLRAGLPSELYYHSVDHTLDVLSVCNKYIRRNKIEAENAQLLRLGALFHDVGFTISRDEHEERGTVIAEEMMSEFKCSASDIRIVQGLIRATKIPQNPRTELEKIIFDADLDYLGRSDYYEIASLLFKELQVNGVVKSEEQWRQIQISFLEKHQYHTEYARKYRQPVKEERLKELRTS